MRLLLEFDGFEEEQKLVGQMLMAYGEFEGDLAALVEYALGGHKGTDIGPRIVFRVHGEAARIDVADAILRPHFSKFGLNGQWGNALGAVRYCKDIRNQYAHCQWHAHDNGTVLYFYNVDRDASVPEGTMMLNMYPTSLELLRQQKTYFEYAADWMYYFSCHCRTAAGLDAPKKEAPKSIPQPPKSTRPKKLPEPPDPNTTPEARPEK